MRQLIQISAVILVLIAGFLVPDIYSQNPTFNLTLANGKQTSNKIFEVDIYLQSTSSTPIELATMSLGISYNNAIKGRGTLIASWVTSSSQLTNQSELPTAINTATAGIIKIAGRIPPGAGNGSIISNISPGTKIGRLQLTNSTKFSPNKQMSFAWLSALPYPTTVNAYVGKVNTDITMAGQFNNLQLSTPLCVETPALESKVQGNIILLKWETNAFMDNESFEIERAVIDTKMTDTIWNTLSMIKSVDLSDSITQYSYSDTKLESGKYQYRLKILDTDSSFTYSNIVETQIAGVPKNFAISQNYPNPFNPNTKIDYQVPTEARVILEVFNITGQKVAELVNQDQSAGNYTVDFGAAGKLASGIYFYRMTASDKATGVNFSAIKKMMLLK